jgi:acetyl esterase/lipase
MDLVAGLHWLHENLPAFNGDPSRVTLMGHGTGAALANMLVVSPVASGEWLTNWFFLDFDGKLFSLIFGSGPRGRNIISIMTFSE